MKDRTPYYRTIGHEEQAFMAAYERRLPILLKGPTGCGKTRFALSMSSRLQREIIQVACSEDTSASDLLGRFLIKGGDTVWMDGPATRAAREGAFLYLDEVAEAREDVLSAIHPLLDDRRAIFLDRTGEKIAAHSQFCVIASFNPGYQRGLRDLKPSLRQRFITIAMSFPAPNVEAEIITQETECHPRQAQQLVGLAEQIRGASQLLLRETASTRLLVNAAILMRNGLDPRIACDCAIAQCLTDDPDIQQALRDIISLRF